MYGYIYITINTKTNMKYIGKHKSEQYDPYYLGSGLLMQKALYKYSRDNFIQYILEYCESLEDLNYKEEYWINYFQADKEHDFYNISKGGNNWSYIKGKFNLESPHTYKKWKQKMDLINNDKEKQRKKSESLKGKLVGDKNPSRYPDGGKKISDGKKLAWKNKSEEEKQKYRNNVKSYMQSSDIRNKISKANKGNYKGYKILYEPITNKRIFVKPEDYNNFLKLGYLAIINKNMGTKGRITVNKDGKLKYIKPEELNDYLNKGYIKGSKGCLHIKIKQIANNKGKICLTNGINNKYVTYEDLPKFINTDFKIGSIRDGKVRLSSTTIESIIKEKNLNE